MAARRRGWRGRSGGDRKGNPPLRQKANAFVYDGQGEHERFGVFDPAVRLTFAVGVLIMLILAGLTVGESVGPGSGVVGAALSLTVVAALALAGILAYRRVWVPPPEREVLLQLAREEDESKALVAARGRGKGERDGAEGEARDEHR